MRFGTSLSLTQPRGLRFPALDLNLALAGALPANVTNTRASTATDLLSTASSGAYNSFAINAPRFLSGLGFLPEESRTQRFGASDTPATQTLTLAAGTYTSWMIGSGSVTSAAGTALGSGFGAATQGSPNVLVVSTGGTVVFTVAGTVTRMQCELGAFPTSYIPNPGAVGTTVTRSADVATMTLASIGISPNPAGLTIIGKARTAAGIGTLSNEWPLSLTDGTTNNRLGFFRTASGGDKLQSFASSGGVGQQSATIYTSPPSVADVGFWLAAAANDFATQAVGKTKLTSGSNVMPTGLTTLNIGSLNAGQFWNSTIARLQIYNRRLPDAQAAAIAASL